MSKGRARYVPLLTQFMCHPPAASNYWLDDPFVSANVYSETRVDLGGGGSWRPHFLGRTRLHLFQCFEFMVDRHVLVSCVPYLSVLVAS